MQSSLTQTKNTIIIGGMEYVSVSEASELISYTEDYIRLLIRKGTINAIKKGGMYWVDKESALEYRRKMDALGTDKHFTWRE